MDVDVIKRCAVVLQTISSGYEVNLENFKKYCLETAEKLISLYPWYYLPASIHKVLIHGPDIVSRAMLPIGQLSEEAAESRNKDIKAFRLNFTRKISREKTNTDLMNRLLLSSDPFISSIIPLPKKKRALLSSEVQLLLYFK